MLFSFQMMAPVELETLIPGMTTQSKVPKHLVLPGGLRVAVIRRFLHDVAPAWLYKSQTLNPKSCSALMQAS